MNDSFEFCEGVKKNTARKKRVCGSIDFNCGSRLKQLCYLVIVFTFYVIEYVKPPRGVSEKKQSEKENNKAKWYLQSAQYIFNKSSQSTEYVYWSVTNYPKLCISVQVSSFALFLSLLGS